MAAAGGKLGHPLLSFLVLLFSLPTQALLMPDSQHLATLTPFSVRFQSHHISTPQIIIIPQKLDTDKENNHYLARDIGKSLKHILTAQLSHTGEDQSWAERGEKRGEQRLSGFEELLLT